MDLEFHGVSAETIENICQTQGLKGQVFPLTSRDVICPKEEGVMLDDGDMYYIMEETCWHGYYICGNIRCGHASGRLPSPSGTSTLGRLRPRGEVSRKRSARQCRNVDCGGTDCSGTDCSGSNDSAGALVIFFLIVAIFLLLIYLSPILGPVVALGIELGLTVLLGIFDLLTFGIFRNRFKRALVYFPPEIVPSSSQINNLVSEIAHQGGLTHRFRPGYGSSGFGMIRIGAYLFIPSLFATILVLWLQPANGFLFRVPITAFIVSILLVWFGNFLVVRRARIVAGSG
ncbi:MAG: hypothetical protein ACFFE8_06715 [Candidatus Heimdallarchaeota archaeon]